MDVCVCSKLGWGLTDITCITQHFIDTNLVGNLSPIRLKGGN